MFTIFLDIDGVLNKESDWKFRATLNKDCIKCFNDLCQKLTKMHGDVRIVLSSTWRAGYTRDGKVSDNDKLKEYGIRIDDITPITNKTRQEEIEYYIRRNGVKDYVILDDDESLFYDRSKVNFYLTDYRTGLTEKDVKKIVRK